ncbi:DegQ family serine endoprotease [Nitrincola sp. MINF-07-Sa-05]|uniref:DegQ family serine endoprotease n=1 Tax=Nitrincola salilacus TaxID=3400273 RepID=UPI0039182805
MKKMSFALGLTLLILLTPLVASAALPDFKSLVREASPAVVNISTIPKTISSDSGPGSPFDQFDGQEVPEIFRHFFRGFPENAPRQQRPSPRSLGSGFIISEDGYVLTNHHVIQDAEKVIVRLNDRRELEAEVVGSDPRSDVALLKLDAVQLPYVRIGSSRDIEVGEWVLAIGSPFGFDYSVTAGIVSATERSLANDSYVPFIQTDVAINPGNSGGPLFNLDGEVIGINSQIYTRSGGFMGLSFAIPIDVAMEVSDQLRDTGTVARGWLGVVIQEVSRDLAESFGLDKPAGAVVVQVMPDSPAQGAGLKEGDVILSFNGNDIYLSSDLPHQVGRVRPGTEASVGIIRGGERISIPVTIGLLPDPDQLIAASGQPEQAQVDDLGLVVSPLTSEQQTRWNVRAGVVVAEVRDGPAAAAGLMVDDIITMLNGERIETVDQFDEVVARLPEDRAVPIRIVRRGNAMFIPLRPGG